MRRLLALILLTGVLGLTRAQDVVYSVSIETLAGEEIQDGTAEAGALVVFETVVQNRSGRELPGIRVYHPIPTGLRQAVVDDPTVTITAPDAYFDANNRRISLADRERIAAVVFEPTQPLPRGATYTVRHALTAISRSTGLNAYKGAIAVYAEGELVRTRVDPEDIRVVPSPAPEQAPLVAARQDDAIEQHVEAMFGRIGVARYDCPEYEDEATRVFCARVAHGFDAFEELWDEAALQQDLPVTAHPLTSWRSAGGIYRRVFDVASETIVVEYAPDGEDKGFIAVFAPR